MVVLVVFVVGGSGVGWCCYCGDGGGSVGGIGTGSVGVVLVSGGTGWSRLRFLERGVGVGFGTVMQDGDNW